jgi:tRNA U34 5-carboxymethylaminomethyl modifying enzyme MnmG/GidA
MSAIWNRAKSTGSGLIDSVSTGMDKFGTWVGKTIDSKTGQSAILGMAQGGATAALQARAQQQAWQRQQDALAQQRGLINTSISGQRV